MKDIILHILQVRISTIQLCNDDDPITIVGTNAAAEEISAYVEQHYYPEEFVEWALINVHMDEDGYNIWISMIDDEPSTYDTLNEIYKYWLTEIKK
jgi:hypothetical protein